jgi:hypothetical protein
MSRKDNALTRIRAAERANPRGGKALDKQPGEHSRAGQPTGKVTRPRHSQPRGRKGWYAFGKSTKEW